MINDVIIIGLGPAGIAAAIYAKRSGLNVLCLESKMPGGVVNYTNVVNNYPGFINITGPELATKMYEHFSSFDIPFKNEDVIDIEDGEVKKVITKKGEYQAYNVIIATGRSRRSLNLPLEKELMGNGISYCAMCDGHFYKDKDVIVVGAGDSSLEESLYLSKVVKSVTILVRGKTLSGSKYLVEEVNKIDNIKIEFESNIVELLTEDNRLSGVRLNDDRTISASGIFIYIGFDPVLPFKSDIGLEKEKGYLVVDKNFETNKKGIYAVGDIIKKDMYQIISAEYEGASAASAIARKIDK